MKTLMELDECDIILLMIQKYKRLSRGKKASLIAGIFMLFVIATPSSQQSDKTIPIEKPAEQQSIQSIDTTVQQPLTVTETKTETKTEVVDFKSSSKNDSTLEKGKTKLSVAGIAGERTITYEVKYEDGKEIGRNLVKDEITIQPVDEVILNGTKEVVKNTSPTPVAPTAPPATSSNCDPNYTGCVPNVYPSDVDCQGGRGNGPYYANGPVQVIGTDRYGLDGNDDDGWGCES